MSTRRRLNAEPGDQSLHPSEVEDCVSERPPGSSYAENGRPEPMSEVPWKATCFDRAPAPEPLRGDPEAPDALSERSESH